MNISELLAREDSSLSENKKCLPEIKTYDLLSPLFTHLEQHKRQIVTTHTQTLEAAAFTSPGRLTYLAPPTGDLRPGSRGLGSSPREWLSLLSSCSRLARSSPDPALPLSSSADADRLERSTADPEPCPPSAAGRPSSGPKPRRSSSPPPHSLDLLWNR